MSHITRDIWNELHSHSAIEVAWGSVLSCGTYDKTHYQGIANNVDALQGTTTFGDDLSVKLGRLAGWQVGRSTNF